MAAALIVAAVVRTIVRDQRVESGGVGIMRHDQRADLGADEVVGAGGPERREAAELMGVDELHHLGGIDEMPCLHAAGRNAAADRREKTSGGGPSLGRGQRGNRGATEGRPRHVGVEPDSRLVDDANRRLVAGLGRIAPGEKPVRAEHDADIAGIRLRHLAELDAEVDAGALPGQVADLATEDLAGQALLVLRRGDRDDGV